SNRSASLDSRRCNRSARKPRRRYRTEFPDFRSLQDFGSLRSETGADLGYLRPGLGLTSPRLWEFVSCLVTSSTRFTLLRNRSAKQVSTMGPYSCCQQPSGSWLATRTLA